MSITLYLFLGCFIRYCRRRSRACLQADPDSPRLVLQDQVHAIHLWTCIAYRSDVDHRRFLCLPASRVQLK